MVFELADGADQLHEVRTNVADRRLIGNRNDQEGADEYAALA
jgi:hypothetical protein